MAAFQAAKSVDVPIGPLTLVWQRVHVIFENRSGVGGRVEIVVARSRAEFVFDLPQDGVSIGREGVLSRPQILDDLKARVVSVRMDAN